MNDDDASFHELLLEKDKELMAAFKNKSVLEESL